MSVKFAWTWKELFSMHGRLEGNTGSETSDNGPTFKIRTNTMDEQHANMLSDTRVFNRTNQKQLRCNQTVGNAYAFPGSVSLT